MAKNNRVRAWNATSKKAGKKSPKTFCHPQKSMRFFFVSPPPPPFLIEVGLFLIWVNIEANLKNF